MAKTSLGAITLSSGSVAAGTSVGIFSSITNLTTRKLRVTVEIFDTPPSGNKVAIASGTVRLNASETKLMSISYATKADTPTGTHVITVASLDRNNVDASVTANLTVT